VKSVTFSRIGNDMADDQIIDAEIVTEVVPMEPVAVQAPPPETAVAVVRDEKGMFAPGNPGPSRSRKGSMNKVSRVFREELAERVQRTGENPLLILLDIASNSAKDEVRCRACDILLGYVMPRKVELSGPDDGDEITEERITRTRKMFAQMFITEVTEVR
jgi:hypothetical protein